MDRDWWLDGGCVLVVEAKAPTLDAEGARTRLVGRRGRTYLLYQQGPVVQAGLKT
jgi:hypothetical protein